MAQELFKIMIQADSYSAISDINTYIKDKLVANGGRMYRWSNIFQHPETELYYIETPEILRMVNISDMALIKDYLLQLGANEITLNQFKNLCLLEDIDADLKNIIQKLELINVNEFIIIE